VAPKPEPDQTSHPEQVAEQSGRRIDALLGELQGLVSGPAWQRVEELMREMLALYGTGLERVLEHASALGDAQDLASRLADDALVSSILVVHGLHPVPLRERVQRALDRVQPYLRSHQGGVELVHLTEDGVVRLRMMGSCHGCPSSAATMEHTVRQAIEDAAPEVTKVELVGQPRPAGDLVPLRSTRDRERRIAWEPAPDLRNLPTSALHAVSVRGQSVLVANPHGARVAYVNRCPRCSSALDGGALANETLTCSCGANFDLVRAGRALDGGPALTPIPLLVRGEGVVLGLRAEAP
jgi:Fe-S cluster biogenesis protein NfuA/nitrite reductase/ring-hydroxylating ferredoxin subunit